MMEEFIFTDMHTHMLPEIDDGAKNQEEMRKMLEIAYNEGTRILVTTPHCHPGRNYIHDIRKIHTAYRLLKLEADKYHDLKVYLGMEFFYVQDVEKLMKERRAYLMTGRYIMIEFLPEQDFFIIRQGVQKLVNHGYKVILAHVERYECLVRDVDNIMLLHRIGAKLQINARSLTDGKRTIKKFIHTLLKNDMVFCFSSDAHDTDKRSPSLLKAAEVVSKKYGIDVMKTLFYENGKKIVKDRIKDVKETDNGR
ncbi:MAG: CpsB/CapC family capsule biosynthesis tyrosine phosphatase [Suipraeoptans sp.]